MAILDSQFPDDRLPNEPELAEQLRVSRTTIRAALQTLERLGAISRTPGRGTRVRPHIDRDCMMLHRVIGFRGLLEGRYHVTVEQSFRIDEEGSDLARKALGLAENMPMLVQEKLLLADNRPAVFLYQEVPVGYVQPGLPERLVQRSVDFPDTIFDFSQLWPNREIDSTVVAIEPRVATEKMPLPLASGTPYLELQETHYSERNEAVAYAREIVDPELVNLKFVRTK